MTEVDQHQALLGMAASGRTDELQSAMLQMLGSEGMDPTTRALLAQSLTPSSGGGEGDDDDDVDDLDQSLDRSERRRRAIRTLRRRFADLENELDELRDRNERFAAAVGACYRCWGEDRRCRVCGGRGRPGSQPRDRELFGELVAPALWTVRPDSPQAPDGAAGQPVEEREV
jgi:hypothetical protein